MRVSVVQMNPGADKAANIEQARRLIEAAVAADRPELVALPETWTCLGGDREAKFRAAESLPLAGANSEGGPAYEFLRKTAQRYRLYVHGGSLGEAAGERLYNTTVVFDPEGAERARYRKIHLFDITGPDGTHYHESAIYGAGERVVTVALAGYTIGLAICYELRFPELFLALRRAGAEVIILPAAFTLYTGKDHWQVLLRARAIETQCWLLAPATCGRHFEGSGTPRETFGHSLICDPWGHVVALASDGPGWASARIEHEMIERVRQDIPLALHRKLA